MCVYNINPFWFLLSSNALMVCHIFCCYYRCCSIHLFMLPRRSRHRRRLVLFLVLLFVPVVFCVHLGVCKRHANFFFQLCMKIHSSQMTKAETSVHIEKERENCRKREKKKKKVEIRTENQHKRANTK